MNLTQVEVRVRLNLNLINELNYAYSLVPALTSGWYCAFASVPIPPSSPETRAAIAWCESGAQCRLNLNSLSVLTSLNLLLTTSSLYLLLN